MKGILVQSTAGQLLNHFKMSIQGMAHCTMLEELTIISSTRGLTSARKYKTKQLAYILCLAISHLPRLGLLFFAITANLLFQQYLVYS